MGLKITWMHVDKKHAKNHQAASAALLAAGYKIEYSEALASVTVSIIIARKEVEKILKSNNLNYIIDRV